MKYTFKKIEKNWQNYWSNSKIFEAKNISIKKKCYILDMFPYPSGSGLHVGHTLGYIISDIYTRYKRSKGYNVLHPMGFDSFGLPAEQYAINTGKHPNITINANIERYKKQLKELGFSFDWTREIRTSAPDYYRWTQWIFIQVFNSWYDKKLKKTRYIVELIKIFEAEGNWKIKVLSEKEVKKFSRENWKRFSFKKKEEILQNFRIAFRSKGIVNWCKDLGTVLANDEIKDGKSERGGHNIYKKSMIQWNMRISAYSDRLLSGLNTVEWPTALKTIQRNWLGKLYCVTLFFFIINSPLYIKVFTKKPYTIFKIRLILLIPEHPLIKDLITNKYKKYIKECMQKRKSKLDFLNRIFIGIYAKNPFTKNEIPIYIDEHVFQNYGAESIMIESSDFFLSKNINKTYIIKKIIEKGIGYGLINYRLHDVVFSRQRYWGEPIPIYYKNNEISCVVSETSLPLLLPKIDKYFPTGDGSSPLRRAKYWSWDEINKKNVSNIFRNKKNIFSIETSTMPGWAGSSWYMLRYMNTKINEAFINAEYYWRNVDLYVGGAEHTTGHLIYSRFWYKILKDHQWISTEEPFKKLINQGMILGNSAYIARVNETKRYLSAGLIRDIKNIQNIPIDIHLLKSENKVDIKKFKKWRKEFYKANLITENGEFYCKRVVEKMSKSKYNVINPDDICKKYGADAFRIYELFLGPIKQDKPWNDQGINGVYHFINKLWNLFHKKGYFLIEDSYPSLIEFKILHIILKKIKEDMVFFSFNTSISIFMIAVNELSTITCKKILILEPIIILISAFAPHISEELWHYMGYKNSISFYPIPTYEEKYFLEKTVQFTIMHDNKLWLQMHFPYKRNIKFIIDKLLNNPKVINYLTSNFVIRLIIIPYLIINLIN